jgi:hypothetical protein
MHKVTFNGLGIKRYRQQAMPFRVIYEILKLDLVDFLVELSLLLVGKIMIEMETLLNTF